MAMATQGEMLAAFEKRARGERLTPREEHLAHQRDYQLDPWLRIREMLAREAKRDRAIQTMAARPRIALAVQQERANDYGPEINLVMRGPEGSRHQIGVHVRLASLNVGAREAIAAGLRSTWSGADDATLIVRTGRSMGAARRAANEGLAAKGSSYLRVYGHKDGLDDPALELVRLDHWPDWKVEEESPEEYMNRCFGRYAGRIERAGLRPPPPPPPPARDPAWTTSTGRWSADTTAPALHRLTR